MKEIAAKYHLTIVGFLLAGHEQYWMFMLAEPETTFKEYPVVVPRNAADHDVDVAIAAAANCAVWYEANLKGH